MILLPLFGTVALVQPSSDPAREPTELMRAVPRDAVAAYFVDLSHGKPIRSTDAQPAWQTAAALADTAHSFGLLSALDDCTRAWVESLTALSTLLKYPHAVILLDAKAVPRPDEGHELDSLAAAVVIDVSLGGPGPIEHRIQHLLNLYANQENSSLTTTTGGGVTVTSVRHSGLRDWVRFTWGALGDRYVVTVGENAFEKIRATLASPESSLIGDPWFPSAYKSASGDSSLFVLHARFDRIRRVGDGEFSVKVDRVLRSLPFEGADRGIWTVARVGRAFRIGQFLHRGSRDHFSEIADTRFLKGLDGVIPEPAGGFAVFDGSHRALLEGLSAAYLAARSPVRRTSARQYWMGMEERTGVKIDNDIISRLGRRWIIHDHPPNVLGLPLIWTFLFQIDGDPEPIRNSVDRLFTGWQAQLVEVESTTRLNRDPDGLWYLSFGVNGPGLLVTDRWVVVSFSPEAVRENARRLSAVPQDLQTQSESKPDS